METGWCGTGDQRKVDSNTAAMIACLVASACTAGDKGPVASDSGLTSGPCPLMSGALDEGESPWWRYEGHRDPYQYITIYRSFLHNVITTGRPYISEYVTLYDALGQLETSYFYDVQCDAEGLKLLSAEVHWSYLSKIGDSYPLPEAVIEYDTPVLLIPATMNTGDTWSTDRSSTVIHESGEIDTDPDARTSTVVGEEELLDIYGDPITAIRVDETDSWGHTSTNLYNAEYGMVQYGALEWSDYGVNIDWDD